MCGAEGKGHITLLGRFRGEYLIFSYQAISGRVSEDDPALVCVRVINISCLQSRKGEA